jgi:hypothetical protein
MPRLTRKLAWWLLILWLCSGVAACREPQEDTVGAGLTGIDHLADHLSVQEFSVDGHSGFQAGKGGRMVCCVSLPRQWHPGMSVMVRWNVTNWRDCHGEEFERRVPVDRYDEVGTVWVHFLSDGSVRVVSANPGPGNPAYAGPHDPIPQKFPWKNREWIARCFGEQKAKEIFND